MSEMEMWRELIAQKAPELSSELALDKVQVNRSGTKMRIRLFAGRLMTRPEFVLVKRSLAAAFPDVELSLRVCYPALADRVRADISEFVPFLVELVAVESPGARTFLCTASWAWDEARLKISMKNSAGAAYLKERGVDQMLQKQLSELFRLDAGVVFESNGDEKRILREIADRQVAEEKRLAQLEFVQKSTASDRPAQPKIVMGKTINDPAVAIKELTQDAGRVTLQGEVITCEKRALKNDTTTLFTFALTDYTGTVSCKAFIKAKGDDQERSAAEQAIVQGAWFRVRGRYQYDTYQREMVLMAEDISRERATAREDKADKKRVELHLHTQMSTMDAVASPTDLIAQAAAWGHPAIAITDHGVLQAFPEAFSAAKKHKIKLIPGCEGYLIDDMAQVVDKADARPVAGGRYVVLDVETTGLNTATDQIIEIGAVRYEDGVETAEFSQLINPQRPIPPEASKVNHITDAMVRGMPAIGDVINDFAAFCEGAVLVAHNAPFDMAFFSRAFAGAGLPFDHPKLDTLTLMRNLYPGQRSYKLSSLCKLLGLDLTKAHRAVHDSRATGQMLLIALQKLMEEKSVVRLSQLNALFAGDAAGKSHHIILLAATQNGLTNLNRLVSEAHLNYFHRVPRIPRGLIQKYRDGLIVGSACEAGELFRAVASGQDERTLQRIAKFYDYLEIQPIGNNQFMVRSGAVRDDEALRELNQRIVALGEKLNIPVVATGDVHFREPRDEIFRTILMTARGFEDADQQAPLYFRTTDDMLREFSYLGEQKAMEVVVDNPNRIAERVDALRIFIEHPEGKETFQPFWPDAEREIREMAETRARQMYGDPMPDIVRARLDKELSAICGYGFSTLYDIAVKLVQKSLSDGYIVGSRGSVGSSFVAFMTGVTEVNSLPPHYVCPKCKHSEFEVPEQYACGLDLPPKACPECGAPMDRDGYNIPFEVFLGFKGDKVPDIDLNFSGVYQPVAHAYVKELFGAENVFRAGTIGTIAQKTAYGYVLKYLEQKDITDMSNAEKERLAAGLTGAKRTTGQHPAGMVVLPKGYEIYQFTAIQHPADDMASDTITTHFDFASMHDVLVKLDILGHDDPTMLRNLQDLTGIAPQAVPLHDPEVFGKIISLFQSPEALGVTAEMIGCPTGTLGIPEFGTTFVRGMLMDTQPSSMEELVRISGLSHGTNVWLGNTQDIIKKGIAPLKMCICTRDDIMNQLIALGVSSKMSFDIMESVRKGKGLKPEMEQAMREQGTPDWFIESCKKIEYMFPKSHAVAYVTMALRIAYFKIYHPEAYYACYLRRNLEKFDGSCMVNTAGHLRNWLAEMRELDKEERDKEEDKISILETLVEMYSRGITLRPVDVYLSDSEEFRIEDDRAIRAPLCSLPGLGLGAAQNLKRVREAGPFISQEDMIRRKITRSVVEQLQKCGALGDLPESSQISLFDFTAGL